MQGNLSASLVKHGIVHRSLGFDYQGIDRLDVIFKEVKNDKD